MNFARPEPNAWVPDRPSSPRERRIVGDKHATGRAGIREHVRIGRIRSEHLANLDDVVAQVAQEVCDASRDVVVEKPRHRASPGPCQGDSNILAAEIRELSQDPVNRPPILDHAADRGRRDAGSSDRRLTGEESTATYDRADARPLPQRVDAGAEIGPDLLQRYVEGHRDLAGPACGLELACWPEVDHVATWQEREPHACERGVDVERVLELAKRLERQLVAQTRRDAQRDEVAEPV